MGLKKFNAKKEIKKLKRRNSKLKKIGIIGILIGTIFIISSYALYSYTGSSVAFNSTISKKIQITINVENGKIEGSTSKKLETDYNQTITEIVTPDEGYEYESASCDSDAITSYNKETKKLTVSNSTKDTQCIVKFKQLKKLLKDAIMANNRLIQDTPDFSKGFPNDDTSEEEAERLSGLYITNDNQGESYYFRGDKNYLKNNIKFANQNWQIVRINGDDTIRLILVNNNWEPRGVDSSSFNEAPNSSDVNIEKYIGFTYDNTLNNECTETHPCEVMYSNGEFNNDSFGGTNSTIKTELEKWYTSNLKEYDNKIATSYYCNDTSFGYIESNSEYYGAYERIVSKKLPSLKCPSPNNQSGEPRTYGGIYKTKIGLLTADEINMAGYSYYNSIYTTRKNYLYYVNVKQNNANNTEVSPLPPVIFEPYMWRWSISPVYFSDNTASLFYLDSGYIDVMSNSRISKFPFSTDADFMPVINLNANVTATGDGSEENPFLID